MAAAGYPNEAEIIPMKSVTSSAAVDRKLSVDYPIFGVTDNSCIHGVLEEMRLLVAALKDRGSSLRRLSESRGG